MESINKADVTITITNVIEINQIFSSFLARICIAQVAQHGYYGFKKNGVKIYIELKK